MLFENTKKNLYHEYKGKNVTLEALVEDQDLLHQWINEPEIGYDRWLVFPDFSKRSG